MCWHKPKSWVFILIPVSFSVSLSVSQFSCSVVSDSLPPHESQHARPPCPYGKRLNYKIPDRIYLVWTASQSLSLVCIVPLSFFPLRPPRHPITDLLPVFFLQLVDGNGGQVSVQLEASSAFLAIPVEKNEESHCICGNKQKTVSWAVTPKSLGEW